MKLKYLLDIHLLGLILVFSDWSTIFEKPLKGSLITLEAPRKNYQPSNYTRNFYWDNVDGALSYHLQIVSPSFDSLGSLILDKMVKKKYFPLLSAQVNASGMSKP